MAKVGTWILETFGSVETDKGKVVMVPWASVFPSVKWEVWILSLYSQFWDLQIQQDEEEVSIYFCGPGDQVQGLEHAMQLLCHRVPSSAPSTESGPSQREFTHNSTEGRMSILTCSISAHMVHKVLWVRLQLEGSKQENRALLL